MSKKLNKFTDDSVSALNQFNKEQGTAWTFGDNWDNQGTMFETYVNKYLFPKINQTDLVNVNLGNRFDFLAREIELIGQFTEEYVILDSVPVSLNLSKSAEMMLKRNYPKMATKLYNSGMFRKTKFTLNNNDARLNFSTLGDAVKYAISVYKKRISDINVSEEKEIKAMLVDYALNNTKEKRDVVSKEDLFNQVFKAILNIQNNSDKYNEATTASGGELGRYTTNTDLQDVAILTNDDMKTYLLNTKIANTFRAEGIDITKRIISFDDLGGVYKLTDDVKITTQKTLEYFRTFNDYQIELDDILEKGDVITFDISQLTEFKDKFIEVKPESEFFTFIFDINKLRYRRNTKDMLKPPFYNGEFDEVTYWIHYYSSKSVSPFFNNVVIGK